jgi:hypothetical protein
MGAADTFPSIRVLPTLSSLQGAINKDTKYFKKKNKDTKGKNTAQKLSRFGLWRKT